MTSFVAAKTSPDARSDCTEIGREDAQKSCERGESAACCEVLFQPAEGRRACATLRRCRAERGDIAGADAGHECV